MSKLKLFSAQNENPSVAVEEINSQIEGWQKKGKVRITHRGSHQIHTRSTKTDDFIITILVEYEE